MLVRMITGFPVKHIGMAIPIPNLTVQENWTTSCVVTGRLIAALCSHIKYRSRYHAQILSYGRAEIKRQNYYEEGKALTAAAGEIFHTDTYRLCCGQNTGVLLLSAPSMVNITELGAQECRDSVFPLYGIEHPDLPQHCDQFGVGFLILYALY